MSLEVVKEDLIKNFFIKLLRSNGMNAEVSLVSFARADFVYDKYA